MTKERKSACRSKKARRFRRSLVEHLERRACPATLMVVDYSAFGDWQGSGQGGSFSSLDQATMVGGATSYSGHGQVEGLALEGSGRSEIVFQSGSRFPVIAGASSGGPGSASVDMRVTWQIVATESYESDDYPVRITDSLLGFSRSDGQSSGEIRLRLATNQPPDAPDLSTISPYPSAGDFGVGGSFGAYVGDTLTLEVRAIASSSGDAYPEGGGYNGATHRLDGWLGVESEPPTMSPIAVFSLPESSVVGSSLRIDGSESFDPDDTEVGQGIVSYTWLVRPEGEFNKATEIGNGNTINYSFEKGGTYVVTLIVTDDEGESSSAEKTIYVSGCDLEPGTAIRGVRLPRQRFDLAKGFDLVFDELLLDFSTEQPNSSGAVCKARSNVGRLPVELRAITGHGVATGQSVGVGVLELLDGPVQTVRWHNEDGFRASITEVFGKPVDISFGTWTETFEAPLADINPTFHWPDNSFEEILRASEAYIHKQLSAQWFGLLELTKIFVDPGATSMRVTDELGRVTGELPSGEIVNEIPSSIYDPSAPAVFVFSSESSSYQTTITGIKAGEFDLVNGLISGGTVHSQQFTAVANQGSEVGFTTVVDESNRMVDSQLRSSVVSSAKGLEIVGTNEDDQIRLEERNDRVNLDTSFSGQHAFSPFQQLVVSMGPGNDIVELDGRLASASNVDSVLIHGGGQDDEIVFLGSDYVVDLSSQSDWMLYGFNAARSEYDLEYQIDVEGINRLADDRAFRIYGLSEGQLTFLDPHNWKMRGSIVDGELTYQVIEGGDVRLEVESANPWTNSVNRYDVNNDGNVSALDALFVINELARLDGSKLPSPSPSGEDDIAGYFDVTGDRNATALDALRVINFLAQDGGGSADAEQHSNPIVFSDTPESRDRETFSEGADAALADWPLGLF